MNLATLSQKLRSTRRSGRLLVVESDGFVLRAAIVKLAKGHATVERVSQSKLADAWGALDDALEGLRGAKLPKRAVLISAEVTSAVLRLPIDPAAPRSDAEMQELIRWELEPHVAVHTGARPIGEILIGRGHLTVAQVTEILEEQNDRKIAAAATIGRRPERFGEVAIAMSLITRGQVDEALEIQRRFQMPADDLTCGWTPLEQSQADEAGQWKWLACGMGRAARDRWAQAFESHGLRLTAIYPVVGTSLAALDGEAAQGVQAVLELQAGLIGAARLKNGHLDAWQWHLTAGHQPSAELCQDLLGHEPADHVWITGRHPSLEAVAAGLAKRLGSTPSMVPTPSDALLPPDVLVESLAGCLGAARHASNASDASVTVALAAHDPGPPAFKRPQVWAAAMVATLLLGLGITELGMRRALTSAIEQRDAAVEKLTTVQGEVARLQAESARVESLRKQLTERSGELKTWSRLRHFLGEDLARRREFLPALFEALKKTTSGDIAIDRISESSKGEIKISFWSLSNKSAEEFAQALHRELGAWQLAVSTRSMEIQKGRLDLPGYAFDVELKAASTNSTATISSSLTGEQR